MHRPVDLAEPTLCRIAQRHGVSAEEIGRCVARRATRLHGMAGWLGPRALAHTVGWSLSWAAAQRRFADFLAAGARHVSGLTIEDAMAASRQEAQALHTATLGYWPQPGEAPPSVGQAYVDAIHAVAALGADVAASPLPGGAWTRIGAASVSIKADHLGFDVAQLRPVFEAARQSGVRLHFDAQAFDAAERTLGCVEQALGAGVDVSATLPARWRRSFADAERMVRWGVPVRVVKGQGADPAQPRIDPRRAFLDLVGCLAGRAAHVAVATHDRRTAEPALLMLKSAGTSCSLEQLRSLPRLDELAALLDVPVRVYIAYGRFGLPYAVGELTRRPAIAGWILRDLLWRRRPAAAVTLRREPT